jgi:hypothetical protein
VEIISLLTHLLYHPYLTFRSNTSYREGKKDHQQKLKEKRIKDHH